MPHVATLFNWLVQNGQTCFISDRHLCHHHTHSYTRPHPLTYQTTPTHIPDHTHIIHITVYTHTLHIHYTQYSIVYITLVGSASLSPLGSVNSLLSSNTLLRFSTQSGSTSPSNMIHWRLLSSPRTLSMILGGGGERGRGGGENDRVSVISADIGYADTLLDWLYAIHTLYMYMPYTHCTHTVHVYAIHTLYTHCTCICHTHTVHYTHCKAIALLPQYVGEQSVSPLPSVGV